QQRITRQPRQLTLTLALLASLALRFPTGAFESLSPRHHGSEESNGRRANLSVPEEPNTLGSSRKNSQMSQNSDFLGSSRPETKPSSWWVGKRCLGLKSREKY
uniref:Uncharacterized protein n=1 Tax=Myripristis murdjan TaxID=586833 RepID=A0A667Y3V7_9TELE